MGGGEKGAGELVSHVFTMIRHEIHVLDGGV
jgi:hypothetical protein